MICSGCEQGFLAVDASLLCPACEVARDSLTCAECGIRMLVPAQRCGICATSAYSRALDAMRCAA